MSVISHLKRIGLATSAFVLLGAVTASAADLGRPAPVMKAVAPDAVWDWTGLYIGGYAGVGVNRSHGVDPRGVTLGELNITGSGFTGGGTLGYNWQFTPLWVLGIEGDFGALDLGHNFQDFNDSLRIDSKASSIGTLRGRIGLSDGPTLTYITAGGAWVKAEDVNNLLGPPVVVSSSKTLSGSVWGTGTETMLGGNWSAKAEYLVADVGSGDTLTNGFVTQIDKHRYHLMKYGVNYRFGGRPQPPLPGGNWGGFYVGLVGGTAVSEIRAVDPRAAGVATVGEIGENSTGFTIGGQAGYNLHLMPTIVVGIEGDWSWLGTDNSSLNFNDAGGPHTPATLGVKGSSIATLRGRLGYSTGPALLYVTGGGAWVNVREDWAFPGATSTSKTLSGSAFGGGIENTFNLFGMLGPNWTTKTEYLFVDVGNLDLPAAPAVPLSTSNKFHLFRSALSYRFGGKGPVVAKY